MKAGNQKTADDHPFLESVVPSSDVIKQRISRNVQENRILRSLYRIARKAEQQRGQGAIAHA
jgi:hypothetical protein